MVYATYAPAVVTSHGDAIAGHHAPPPRYCNGTSCFICPVTRGRLSILRPSISAVAKLESSLALLPTVVEYKTPWEISHDLRPHGPQPSL